MKRLLIMFAATLAVIGCGGGKSFNGDWNVTTSAKTMPAGTTIKATFADPDKMTMTMDIPQPLPNNQKLNIHMVITGSYKVEGELMTLHADDVKVSGTGFPDSLKSTIESSFKTMGEQVKTELNKEGTEKLKWVDDNSFTLTGTESTETFTRSK